MPISGARRGGSWPCGGPTSTWALASSPSLGGGPGPGRAGDQGHKTLAARCIALDAATVRRGVGQGRVVFSDDPCRPGELAAVASDPAVRPGGGAGRVAGGPANPNVTLTVYSHFLLDREATDLLGRLLTPTEDAEEFSSTRSCHVSPRLPRSRPRWWRPKASFKVGVFSLGLASHQSRRSGPTPGASIAVACS